MTPDTLILDGGLATELERRGLDLDDALWSARALIEGPEVIQAVHRDYFLAGADVAISASYQASFEGFAARGIGEAMAAGLMRRSVELAAAARDEAWAELEGTGRVRPQVAASIGCYGACLADGSEYRGDYGLSIDALCDWHRPRLAVLAVAGADLLACETIPCLAEAEALVRLLEELPDVRAWLSFSCKDGARVCHGEPFAECVALADACDQVIAVGLNCTPPQFALELLEVARAVTSKPLVVYPNSGEDWDAGKHLWLPGPPTEDLAALAPQWHVAGARFIGGCCRTRPKDIRAIRAALK